MHDELIDLVIDDSVINSNDVFKIIEPLWWSVSIYEGEDQYNKDLSRFSSPQQYIFAIQWYLSEVNNGGHYQFYDNSTGIVWQEAMNGFKEINLIEFYDLIKESTIRLGGNPSKDRDERQGKLEEYEPDFEDLDTKLYELEDNLEIYLMDYIRSNRSDFYFSGKVAVPKEFR
ncbi:DMP19 family protein [Paenibacillus sedimenti]|uniref:DMP19 family protein n=1 Tax=Paenibacillus sedimenti TaxID=2770274 RepID=A0A926KLU6_9BACL|nr:DMP19 family protein [Paenibacillus sedimenti]MBD0380179.1 DMP19 family protein [Paenibacillus sedimenti]